MFLDRRAALQLAFSSASAALLAACGGAASPAVPTAAPPAAPATSVPAPAPTASGNALGLQAAPTVVPPSQAKLGGTLRIGMVGDITGLDPFIWSPNNSNTIG